MKRKTKYYIDFPSKLRLPLTQFLVIWLLLDRFNSPQWGFAIYWTLAAIVLTLQVWSWCDVDSIEVDIQDLLKKENEKNEQFKKVLEKFKDDIKVKIFKICLFTVKK